ncbi:MAG: hypothetical protein LBJ64_01985 [Deltaproteobacteria bacterium]|nr:hypothetical protein [Deltaproteobacteria bacterium]
MQTGPNRPRNEGIKKTPGPSERDKAALKASIDKLFPLLEPHLKELGLEVIDLSLLIQSRRLIARFTIDKPWTPPLDNAASTEESEPSSTEPNMSPPLEAASASEGQDAQEGKEGEERKEEQEGRKNGRRKSAKPAKPAFVGQNRGSGVTVDDCAALSRIISSILDQIDSDQGPEYSLEVSSPGLDRPLRDQKDFERFAGHLIKLKLNRDGKTSSHKGRLLLSPLRLSAGQGDVPFDLSMVVSARLVPEL